mgnify:CR=1 FL=1
MLTSVLGRFRDLHCIPGIEAHITNTAWEGLKHALPSFLPLDRLSKHLVRSPERSPAYTRCSSCCYYC